MLEGKLKIELTDVKTGKKTVHEQHNLVTDNVQTLLNSVDPRCLMPLCDKGMGGLLLFDSSITGASGNHFIGRPKNSKLVGYADRNVDISTAYKGSRNAAECVRTDDSYTTVWDFSTAQLNSTIGAIALAPLTEHYYNNSYTYSEEPGTNNLFSNRGTRTVNYAYYRNEGSLGQNNYYVPSSYCQPVYYDPVTNYVYFIQYLYGTNVTIFIVGRFRLTMNYGVTQEAYSTERAEILFTSASNDGYADFSLTYDCEDAQGVSATTHQLYIPDLRSQCWYGDKQGYVYAISTESTYAQGTSSRNGSRILWAKFKAFDGSFDCVEAKYAEFEGKYFSLSPSSYAVSSSNKGSFAALLDDDKFIVVKNDTQGCYILTKSVSGVAVTDDLTFTSNKEVSITVAPQGVAYMGGGIIYSNGSRGDITVGIPGGANYTYYGRATFYPYECPVALYPASGNTTAATLGIPNLLLSTICNLSQPVQKTSAQTMKITYTITSYRPMYVSTQPHDTSGPSGTAKTLTVAVMDGVPAYTYQWKVSSDNTNWSNCSGTTATTANYNFALDSSTGDKYYRCVVTDSLGNSVTSMSAYVTLTT